MGHYEKTILSYPGASLLVQLGPLFLPLSWAVSSHVCACSLLINTIWCGSIGLCSCKGISNISWMFF